jgi:hypothetical protein
MRHQTNLRMVLCCVCGLVFAERVTAVSILLTDGRTISSGASAILLPGNNLTPFNVSDSDSASPSVPFGVFISTVNSAASSATTFPEAALSGSASQNSTVTPTSFSASGEATASGNVSIEGASSSQFRGNALGRSLYSIRFQLLDCYNYDFMGATSGDASGIGDGIATAMARMSLIDEQTGSIFNFTALNQSSASASGLLSPGIYLLQAEASVQLDSMNFWRGDGRADYSFTLNLTPCVPDGGSTALMAGLGFLALVAVRRRYWQKDC